MEREREREREREEYANQNHSKYSPYIVAGYGRNQAIKQSSGKFLCFLDAVRLLLKHTVIK